MPPKRTQSRRAGGSSSAMPDDSDGEDILELLKNSSPNMANPDLPPIPISSSWSYGSPAPAIAPRRMTQRHRQRPHGLRDLAQSLDTQLAAGPAGGDVGIHIHVDGDTGGDADGDGDGDGHGPNERSSNGARRTTANSNSRSRKRAAAGAASLSPVRRRSRRAPTPDQAQLLGSLRQVTASVSPAPPSTKRDDDDDDDDDGGGGGRSTATPTPPTLHSFPPSESTPVAPSTTFSVFSPARKPDGMLYPSPLHRLEPVTDYEMLPPGALPDGDSLDTESVMSWSLEREINDDELHRTRPSKYREEPRGRNISKPPRRASGLAFAHSTIIEEEEEEEEEGRTDERANDGRQRVQKREEIGDMGEREESESEEHGHGLDATRAEATAEQLDKPRADLPVETFSAPARTIISGPLPSEKLHLNLLPSSPGGQSPRSMARWVVSEPRLSLPFRRKTLLLLLRSLAAALAVVCACLVLLYLGSSSWRASTSHVDHPPRPPDKQGQGAGAGAGPGPASSVATAVVGTPDSIGKLGDTVSSLAEQLESLQTLVERMAHQSAVTTVVEPATRQKKEDEEHRARAPAKINFLTVGNGAVVDPLATSPTAGRRRPFLHRVLLYMNLFRPRTPNGPLAALTGWEDMGDCWCSAPRAGMSQLSILLGRPIVPEEVVVEHIPKGAAIDPGVAPRQMELWARFRHYGGDNTAKSNSRDRASSSSSSSSSSSLISRMFTSSLSSRSSSGDEQQEDSPRPVYFGQMTLRETLMETLHLAYPNEPDSAYSDDELLDPSFFRIGKWEYDIDADDHVQRFGLDVVVDVPAFRVDKVVLRVKSNWGAPETCLYRVRLHGHL